MPGYVDGYLLPVPKKKLAAYRRMAKMACKIWLSNGALDYRESAGDDLQMMGMGNFVKPVGAKASETVIFAYVVFKSRAHRDKVNAKAMKDPRLAPFMDPKKMPFDCKRMICGGFKTIAGG